MGAILINLIETLILSQIIKKLKHFVRFIILNIYLLSNNIYCLVATSKQQLQLL